jgi:hypothetical protein
MAVRRDLLYAQDIHLKPSSPTRLHKQSMHRRSRVESYCCHTVHDSFSSKSSQLMSSGLSNVIAINTPHFMFQLWPSGTDSPYMTLPQSDPPTTCANSPEKNAVLTPERFRHSGPPIVCNRPPKHSWAIWAWHWIDQKSPPHRFSALPHVPHFFQGIRYLRYLHITIYFDPLEVVRNVRKWHVSPACDGRTTPKRSADVVRNVRKIRGPYRHLAPVLSPFYSH